MRFYEMTIDELISYKAAVEAYGSSRELYEVAERINELKNGGM